ncbi:non-ribosomal peptide synthetase [Spirosoma fluviale]|uniref:Amino acid adenylation domain-containing protein n=1 Tax=Spirosoma fluviale TaxID=1597977 RepID=A0A286GUG1_9BACT|nr:non-ribosomal peptide synthetase [Spirosoma fluviale]SOD99161.1 amino acid adenylation domain-containing protein [Spirosoma fluviale]
METTQFYTWSEQQKRDWLSRRLQTTAKRPVAVPSDLSNQPAASNLADRTNRSGPYPLTDIQTSFLVGKSIGAKSDRVGCHYYCEFRFDAIENDRLQDALNLVVARHDILRTQIRTDGTQQLRSDTPVIQIPTTPVDGLFHEENKTLMAVRRELSHRFYTADEWPYFQLCITKFIDAAVLHFSIDEWIADAMSVETLLGELEIAYQGHVLTSPSAQFSDYQQQLERVSSPGKAQQQLENYWKPKLATLPADPAPFPQTTKTPSNGVYFERKTRSFIVSAGHWQRIQRFCDQQQVSASALLVTILAESLFFRREPGQYPILMTFFNRFPVLPKVDTIVGPFISSSIFQASVRQELPLREVVAEHQKQLWNDLDHSVVSGIAVLRSLKQAQSVASSYSIPVVFTSLLNTLAREQSTWRDRLTYSISQTPQIFFDHQVFSNNGQLHLKFDYVDEVVGAEWAESTMHLYVNTLLAIAAMEPETDSDVTVAQLLNRVASTSKSFINTGEARNLPQSAATANSVFPLTALQQAYCFGRNRQQGQSRTSSSVYYEFEVETIDVARLETALNDLIGTHDMMRAVVFPARNQQQVLTNPGHYAIQTQSVGPDKSGIQQARLKQRERFVNHEFVLSQWPLFQVAVSRFEGASAVLHVLFDTLVFDGQSINTILYQLIRHYQDATYVLPRPTFSFRQHVVQLEQFSLSKASVPAWTYWKDKFATLPVAPRLAVGQGAVAASSGRVRHDYEFDAWPQLVAKAQELGVEPGVLLFSLYQYVLEQAQPDAQPFTLVMVNWDRPIYQSDLKTTVGDFTLVSWITSPAEAPRSLTDRILANDRQNRQDVYYSSVSGLSGYQRAAATDSRLRQQQYPYVFTNLISDTQSLFVDPGFRLSYSLSTTPNVFLDVINFAIGDRLHFHWDETEGVFPAGLISSLFSAYIRLLDYVATTPNAWTMHDFSILQDDVATATVDATTDQLINSSTGPWNDTFQPYDLTTPIHKHIEARAAEQPAHPAVVVNGQSINYGEFNANANALAACLRDKGTAANQVVAVLMDRSYEMVLTLVAILKAGGAYLPIDPSLPAERIAHMLENAGVRVLCMQDTYQHLVERFDGQRINCQREFDQIYASYPAHNPNVVSDPESLAYVIYTSGSTGKPKGCMISHRAIANRLLWMQAAYPLQTSDKILQKTPYSFDVSVWEFFWPLMMGATVVVAKPNGHRDPRYLVNLINQEGVTVCHFVPSMFAVFLNEPQVSTCQTLRYIFTSGEALPYTLIERHADQLAAVLVNLYGPTEAAVDVTYWNCEKRADKKVFIGRPIANIQIHILDEHLNPVPVGETGELYLAGVGLAQGYLNNPALTQERFIDNPINPQFSAKLYKTGDEGRYDTDGNIEFLGRRDFQVKIRGLRIELGEIELALLAINTIREAVVLVQDAAGADPRLVAYLTVSNHFDLTDVRRQLAAQLPAYCLPQHIVVLDTLPVTVHGKLDRHALPWPVPAATGDAEQKLAESNDTAQRITRLVSEFAQAMTESLQITKLSATSDFFELGATSFTLINVLQQVAGKDAELELPIDIVMANPTLQGIQDYLQHTFQKLPDATSATLIDRVAIKIEQTTQPKPVNNDALVADLMAFVQTFLQQQLRLTDAIQENTNFFELGATSLTIINLAQSLSEQFACDVSVEELLGVSTLRTLRTYLKQTTAPAPAIVHQPAASVLEEVLPFNEFSAWLENLKALEYEGKMRYAYPSAGGVYPLQTYVYVKPDRIEGITAGYYYYHPLEHALYALSGQRQLSAYTKSTAARLVDEAAFVVFFVGCLDAIEPLYLNVSSYFITLDAGYAGQLLFDKRGALQLTTTTAFNSEAIRTDLQLDGRYVFTYALVGTTGSSARHWQSTGLFDQLTVGQPETLAFRQADELNELKYSRLTAEQKQELENRHLQIRVFKPDQTRIALAATGAGMTSSTYRQRSAKRQFTGQLIPQAQLIDWLKQETVTMAASLRILIYVKPNSVKSLEAGYYWYNAELNRLDVSELIEDTGLVNCHTPFNRAHYQASAFSIFLVSDSIQSQQQDGEAAFHNALLRAGSSGQSWIQSQSRYCLGLCPIGGFNYEYIRNRLRLAPSSQLIHSLLGGAYDYASNMAATSNPSSTDSDKRISIGDSPVRRMQDIAIVGVNVRVPMADDLDTFWQNLYEGRNGIGPIPADRWLSTRDSGGFIRDIDQFDAAFFGISAYEADYLDPQVRLLLESVWCALEDAGWSVAQLKETHQTDNTKVGVFVGCMYEHYHLLTNDPDERAMLALHSYSSLANRISHFFDFRGPSLAIDTACSSSLMAIHLACENIRQGNCQMAVAGGINLTLHPSKYQALQKLGLISSDTSLSRSFGNTDGYVPGEGLGMVVMKPLEAAIRDHDFIYGVVKGSASNHCGRSSGYSMPNSQAYVDLMTEAVEQSGVDPATISFVESAANGAPLSDTVEFTALKTFFKAHVPSESIPIGTVKSNIGHLEAASGLSQLTKVLLQLQHRKLVPTINHQPVNPLINIAQSPFRFVEQPTDWLAGPAGLRRAGIGSFAAGGTNVFMVVEEGPNQPAVPAGNQFLFCFSAPGHQQLNDLLQRMLVYLADHPSVSLANVSYTLANGRNHFAHRIAIVATSLAELSQKISEYVETRQPAEGVYAPLTPVESPIRLSSKSRFATLLRESLSQAIFEDIASLWTTGFGVDWYDIMKVMPGSRIPLPTTPFQKKRHWLPGASVADGYAIEAPDVTLAGRFTLAEASEPDSDVTAKIRHELAAILRIDVAALLPHEQLTEPVNSLVKIRLMNRLMEQYSVLLKASRFVQCKSIHAIQDYLNEQIVALQEA